MISSFIKSYEEKKLLKSKIEYVVHPLASNVRDEFEELIEWILEFSRRESLSCEDFSQKFEEIFDTLQSDMKKTLIEIIKIYQSDPKNFRKVVKKDFVVIAIQRMAETVEKKGEEVEMNDFVESIKDMKLPEYLVRYVNEWKSIMEGNLRDVNEEKIKCMENIMKSKK